MILPNFYAKWVHYWIFPVHEWLKSHPTQYWVRQFRKMQYWPIERQKKWQFSQLDSLIQDTYQHHPFYRQKWKKLPKRLSDIPFTEKLILKNNQALSSPALALDCQSGYTSGSSGEPLYYYQSKHRIARDIAAKWRCLEWLNLTMGTREAVIWGSPLEWKRYTHWHKLRDVFLNTKLFPITHIDESSHAGLASALRQYQPKLIMAYPSLLECLVRSTDTSVDWQKLNLSAVITTAEELLPQSKLFLSSQFKCPIINSYGAREAGFIAQSCLEGNLHIMSENLILEIIDPVTREILPEEEIGEIVITNLSSYGYPIIRYRTGDLGSITTQPCQCGIALPILKHLEGRYTDLLISKKYQKIHRSQFSEIFSKFPMIEQFKIIQYTLDHIDILYAPNKIENDVLQKLKKDIEICLAGPLKVNLIATSQIRGLPHQKHRFIENRMSELSCTLRH